MPFHPDAVRQKIKAMWMLHKLHEHIAGNLELSITQIRAIDILLKKCVPDLTATQVTANVTHRYVAELPPMLDRDEWLKKYGGNHLDLPALPPETPARSSGNGSLQ